MGRSGGGSEPAGRPPGNGGAPPPGRFGIAGAGRPEAGGGGGPRPPTDPYNFMKYNKCSITGSSRQQPQKLADEY